MGEKDKAKKEDGGGIKGDAPTTVVLKLDLHCEGCAKKVKRLVRHFDGVVDVKADATNNKLMVTGSVDPAELREKVELKTGKIVELLSPQATAKKDAGGGGGKGGDNKKADEKPAEKKKPMEDTKKTVPKPVPTSTVVLKIRLHCDGCTKKIKRVIAKTKGVDSLDVDVAKDLITVKGAIESKELVSYLKGKLNRSVEAVAPMKEGGGGEKKEVKKDEGGGGKKEKQEKEGGGGGEKKEKESGGDKKKEGGNEKKENGGGEKKEAGGGQSKGPSTSGGDDDKKSDKGKSEASKMDHHYGYPQYSHYTEPIQSRGFVDEGYSMAPHYNHQGYNYEHGYSSQGYTTQVYANQSYSSPSYTQTYPNHGHNVEYSHQPPPLMYYQAPPPQGDYLHAPPPHGDYLHAPPTPAYVHAPQMFSDENPNACSVM